MRHIFKSDSFRIFLLFFTITVLVSCGKEGPEGALGPQGEAGTAGPAGNDGSIIYNGSAAPAAGVGNIGDYYVNTANGDFYGPKKSTGWGTPFNLRGAKGDKGDAGTKGDKGDAGTKGDKGDAGAKGDKGSQILSGNGTPSSALGVIGDYYLDKTSYILYGPKQSATVWGAGLMLQGKDGNANVKSFILKNYSVPNSQTIFSIRVPAITSDILDNGAVMVYLRYAPLSDTQTVSWKFFPVSIAVTSQITVSMLLDNMQPGLLFFNQGTSAWSRYGSVDFRIVVIQGTSGGVLARKQNELPISFDELKAMYGLRD